VEGLIETCGAWHLRYSEFDEALPALERLLQEGRP
jgi:hypothetical protein